ncbi:hypothetical protein [Frankia sp. CcWB2]
MTDGPGAGAGLVVAPQPAVDPDAPPPGGWFGLRVLPAGRMRGLLMIVTGLVTVVIALGDLASAWVVGVLPLTVGAMVAYHEVLERLIRPDDVSAEPAPLQPGARSTPCSGL